MTTIFNKYHTILFIFYFVVFVDGYCKCLLKNPFIKITKIEPLFTKPYKNYYTEDISTSYSPTWDDGEVAWDFPDFNQIYNNNNKLPNYYTYDSIYENSIYEKYFKDRFYLRIRTSYFKELYFALIKNAYKDIVKLENFAFDVQDLAFDNIKGVSVESDLALLLIASGLSILYNKNKEENIQKLRVLQQSSRKKNTLENYRQIKRASSIIFVVFMTIFGRNIKNAE